ncbi:MAG TPA: leucine/isoleucine/valine transporter permease subunit, partial [Actinomycetota bacterium]
LTWGGAIGLFVLAASADALWHRSGPETRDRVRATMAEQPAAKTGIALVVLAALVGLPLLVGSVISQVLGSVMVFVLLGLGLNIVVGYAGLLDLGYVAFYAFGAYMMALLTGAALNTTTGSAAPAFSMDLNFYIAIWVVVVLAAGVGLLIGAPVLRLRGDYLAIVTLGLGEIVRVLAESRWLQPLVGGPQGMRGVTDAAIFGYSFRNPQHFYYLALAFVLLAVFVSWRLAASRIGRAWNAMREDEQVADAMGVSTTRYKLLAFAMGGAVGSLGGALFAVQIGSLTPASFQILVSITALAVVILGGLGSIPGVVAGAAVLIGLPGLLREFEEFRLLIYGAVLVAIMVLRPQGLLPNVRRMRELHEEEEAQDEWVQRFADETAAVAAVPGGSLGVEEEDLK